jgi:hypothetical protein
MLRQLLSAVMRNVVYCLTGCISENHSYATFKEFALKFYVIGKCKTLLHFESSKLNIYRDDICNKVVFKN